jgi:hypothetical protein
MMSIFEQQTQILLSELSTIINEKWPSLNISGCSYVKNITNLYSDIPKYVANKEDDEEDSNLNSKESKKEFNVTTLNYMRECNELYDKLEDLLKNFEFYLNKLNKIKNGLANLKLEPPKNALNNYLIDLCENFKKELNLKQVLAKKFLFESRLDDDSKVAIVSAWMHQPYVDEMLIFKINSLLDNNYNKNKK